MANFELKCKNFKTILFDGGPGAKDRKSIKINKNGLSAKKKI